MTLSMTSPRNCPKSRPFASRQPQPLNHVTPLQIDNFADNRCFFARGVEIFGVFLPARGHSGNLTSCGQFAYVCGAIPVWIDAFGPVCGQPGRAARGAGFVRRLPARSRTEPGRCQSRRRRTVTWAEALQRSPLLGPSSFASSSTSRRIRSNATPRSMVLDR
jgi:hypothetical protein